MIGVNRLRDIWSFREFILSSVLHEFQSRWIKTQFGPAWLLVQPLATIFIFTVIFANIMRPGMPAHDSKFAYSIYLCAGIIFFNLFSEMLSRCVSVLVDNANLIKKIHFPRICLPLIVLVSSLLNFSVILGIFLGFLLITGAFPGWVVLSALPVLLIQILFTMGLGMLLASVNVFYRDIQQTVQVLLQFWFWLTPIVYLTATLPSPADRILAWNPVCPLIQAYQGIFLEHAAPDPFRLVYPLILGLVLAFAGLQVFQKLQGEIVDEL